MGTKVFVIFLKCSLCLMQEILSEIVCALLKHRVGYRHWSFPLNILEQSIIFNIMYLINMAQTTAVPCRGRDEGSVGRPQPAISSYCPRQKPSQGLELPQKIQGQPKVTADAALDYCEGGQARADPSFLGGFRSLLGSCTSTLVVRCLRLCEEDRRTFSARRAGCQDFRGKWISLVCSGLRNLSHSFQDKLSHLLNSRTGQAQQSRAHFSR